MLSDDEFLGKHDPRGPRSKWPEKRWRDSYWTHRRAGTLNTEAAVKSLESLHDEAIACIRSNIDSAIAMGCVDDLKTVDFRLHFLPTGKRATEEVKSLRSYWKQQLLELIDADEYFVEHGGEHRIIRELAGIYRPRR